jgi:hypothetical protein
MLAVSAGATEDKAIWTPVPTRVEGTLPKGRWVVRLGQVLWNWSRTWGLLSRDEVAGLRCSLLPQRVDGGTGSRGEGSGGDTEGDPPPGRRASSTSSLLAPP